MENVSNVASPQDDGAGEKLVDEKNGHNSKGVEVKYVTPTSQNGDAKIDIENLKSAFAGMGKEELMKFANDPFWVRTRWFLFILFWLTWIAMLAGAIAIIVLAPRCAPPTPRQWWEQSPLYKVDLATFTKNSQKQQGDLKGFTTKLDYLQSLGVKTIVLSNVLKVSDKNSDGVDEFKTVAPSFGTLDDLTALISAAEKKGLQLILTLVPNHSSLKNTLFNQSLPKNSSATSYYVWAPKKSSNQDGEPIPPNNWLNQINGSAWEWNEQQEEFYLHQFSKDEPEFNFHNPDVVKYFDDVMQFWLDKGVNGFYIERAAYLLEDKELKDEVQSRDIGAATHTEYAFYDHSHTKNQPELEPLLAHWKELVGNNSGILILDKVSLRTNHSIAQLTVIPQTLRPYPDLSSEDIFIFFNTTLKNNPWPAWQVQIQDEAPGSQMTNALLLTTLLLPGIPVTQAGQELGLTSGQDIPWDTISVDDDDASDKAKHSTLNVYRQLVEARSSPSILHGSLEMHVFNGTSVLGYTRLKSGNPGYLVVLNMGDEVAVVDTRLLSNIPDELTLLVSSDPSSQPNSNKVESQAVTLPARSVAAFTFVPKSKE